MAGSTFLIIGVAGLVLLAISALLGSDHADLDTDVDLDLDLDVDLDVDMDTDLDVDLEADADSDIDGHGPTGHGGGGGVLEWLSVKAIAVAAVGFGFVGWATTSNEYAGAIIWTASIVTGLALWALAVKFLFPWLKTQQGHDLQKLDSYNGLTAEVVVRIPANAIGTVQFTDPSGAVVRRDARSNHKDHEVAAGSQVIVLLSTSEHVVVDEFSFLKDLES